MDMVRRGLVCIFVTTLFVGSVRGQGAAKVLDPSRREYFTPGLVLETGARTVACDVLRFTRDGNYLLATGDDKVVRNWKVTVRGFEESDLPILRWRIFREVRGNIYAMDLSPDESQVLVGGHGTQGLFAAAVLDRESGKILAAVDGGQGAIKAQGTIWSAAFSPSGRRVVLGTERGTVWLWDPAAPPGAGLQLVGDYRPSEKDIAANRGKVYFVGFADENSVISIAGDGRMMGWNANGGEGRLLHQFPGYVTVAPALSPDRKWLGVSLEGDASRPSGMQVVSFPDGRPEPPIKYGGGKLPHRMAFNRDGRFLAVSVRLVNASGAFFQETGGYVEIFDRAKGTKQKGPAQTLYAEGLAFSPKSDDILAVAGGNDCEVTLWNLRLGKKIDEKKSPGNSLWTVALSPDARYVAFQDQRNSAAPSPNQRGTGQWRYFDLQGRKFVEGKAPFVPSPPLQTAGGWVVEPSQSEPDVWFVRRNEGPPIELPWNRLLDEFPRCYAFLPEVKDRPSRLLVGHYWGVSMFELTDKEARRIRLFRGHEGYVTSLAVSRDGRKLITSSRDQTLAGWDLGDWPSHPSLGAEIFRQNDANGRPALKVGKVDLGGSLWELGLSAGDEIQAFAVKSKKLFYDPLGRFNGRPELGAINKMARLNSADEVMQQLNNASPGLELYFGFFRPSEGKYYEQLTSVQDRPLRRFFPMRDKEWVLWRWRDYYYDTSTNGDYQIGWQRSYDIRTTPTFFRAEQFRNVFLRPDLVKQMLVDWKSEQRLVRIQEIEPPKVEMSLSSDKIAGNAGGDAKDVDVVVRVLPQGTLDNQLPARVIVWLNDYEFKVWQLDDLAKEGNAFVARGRLPERMFRRGDNLVTAQCYSKAELRAEAPPVRITCTRDFVPPKMYGLVVAVGNYSECRKRKQRASFENLRSTDDADVVYRALKSQKGKLYADVQLSLLKDSKATPNSILGALDRLAKQVTPDDLLVFHMGGHGIQLSELTPVTTAAERRGVNSFLYCFGDFDLKNLASTTLGFDQLAAKFVKIPCQKVLLIDACHSGGASSGLATDEDPIRVLTRDGVGPVILTSCDAKQSAQEDASGTIDPGGACGFFSIAIRRILEETDGFAAADKNRDGLLDAQELALGIRSQVAGLVRQLRTENVAGIEAQDPVDFVPRLLERLPVAKK